MALFEVALRDHLAALGLTDGDGLVPTWYVGLMPDQEGAQGFAVAVIPEPGLAPVRILGDRPQITIRVRHPKAVEANTFMRQVYLALQEFSSPNLASSGVGVARITATQGPVQIGRDDGPGQGRWSVQQTFQAIVARY